MAYMRLKPIGTGALGDYFRVPLPTYRLLADMGAQGWIVELRDEDIPDGAPAPTVVNVPGIGNVSVITNLSPAALAAWKTQLDKTYPQRYKAVDPVVQ